MAKGYNTAKNRRRLVDRLSHAMRGTQNNPTTAGGNDPDSQMTVGQHLEWASGKPQTAHPGFEDGGMPDPFDKNSMADYERVKSNNAFVKKQYGESEDDPFNTPAQNANIQNRAKMLKGSWGSLVENANNNQVEEPF